MKPQVSRPGKGRKDEPASPPVQPPPSSVDGLSGVPAGPDVLTSSARERVLDRLPSLDLYATASSASGARLPSAGREQPAVDAEAAPPPPPPAPPLLLAAPEGAPFVDRGLPIPGHYGMDVVVALARDPHWLFVYWELAGGSLERLRFKYSSELVDHARWVLRVESTPATQRQLVDIDLKSGSWHLKVLPERRYRIELGFFNPRGDLEVVCRSREAATPRGGLSPLLDEAWGVGREDLGRLLDAAGAGRTQESGASAPAAPRAEHPRAAAFFSGRGK